jgi:ERCC4-type nuclease
MTLIIDSREKSTFTALVESKAMSLNIPIERKWIEIGDYVIGDVCFEAKSTTDFIGSILSKRLWTQLDNMDRCFKNNIVVIYGSLDDGLQNSMHYGKTTMPLGRRIQFLTNKFYGGLSRILIDSDVKPIWIISENTAANLVTSIAKMQPIDRPPIQPHLFKRVTTDDVRVNMLSTIKGISEKKAKVLLKKYGSIIEIADCNTDELCSLDGIGKTTANRILSIFNSEKKVKQ